MNSLKLASLILMVIGLIAIVLGGLYNPQSAVVTMGPGEVKSFVFSMNKGISYTFQLKGTDYFTFYIMNETSYDRIEKSNFTDSIYSDTVKNTTISFVPPESGTYYFVIANVNSQGYVQVVLKYGESNGTIAIIIGAAFSISAIGVSFYDYRKNKRKEEMDEKCPHCGAPVSSSWEFCPHCGSRLKEGEQ